MMLPVRPAPLQYQHTPFVCKIRLVPDQHDDDVASSLCPDVVDPFGGLLEGVDVWQDANRHVRYIMIYSLHLGDTCKAKING